MKNLLTHFSKIRGLFSASQCSDVGYDCRLTVVRPSFDCRSIVLKLCSILVIVLTVGVGQMWGATETLSTSEIQAMTDPKLAYGTEVDKVDGSVTWTASGNTDAAGRPWIQIKKANNAYIKIAVPSGNAISNLTVTITAAENSKGGVTDITKHTDFSGYIYVNSSASATPETSPIASTNTISDDVMSLDVSGSNNVLYLQPSAAARVWGITVTYGSACDKTVTLNTGSATNGTISYTSSVATCSATEADRNVTISVSPSSGYTLLSSTRLTFTKSSGTATASYVSGPTWNGSTSKYEYIYRFAQNDKGAGSFSVTCDAIPRYTVSFNTGTGNPTQANIQEASAGSGITLPAGPTPTCSGDGWSFAGWKETSPVSSETTVAPTLLSAGNTFHPSGDVTLYAVYSKGNYTKITNTSDITNGGKYIVVAYYNSKNYVMTNSYNSTTYKLAGSQIDETSSNTYSLASISSAYCVTTETGYHSEYWYIRDCYNSSSSNYLDTYYESAWYGHAKDEYDDYEFDYSGGYWSITNKYGSYPNIGFEGSSTSFICSASNDHPLLLYKLSATYYSNPTCCTPLGTINGSF